MATHGDSRRHQQHPIGAGTNVQDLSVLHVSHKSSWGQAAAPLIIGSNVTIGHNVILHGCTIE